MGRQRTVFLVPTSSVPGPISGGAVGLRDLGPSRNSAMPSRNITIVSTDMMGPGNHLIFND